MPVHSRVWDTLSGRADVTLQTRLSFGECCTRLASVVDEERLGFSLSCFAGSKPILRKMISHDRFRLRKRIYYRNTFRRFFYGRLVPSNGGTLVKGEFRMRPLATAYVAFAYAFLLLGAIAAICSLDPSNTRGLVKLTGCIGFFAVITFVIKSSQWLGRKNEREIVDVLKSTLEANEIQTERPGPAIL
jgi:hypothetical protein